MKRRTGFGQRLGDWAEHPPIVDRSPLPDIDDIDLSDIDEDERQIYLDARERKAKRLAQEEANRDRQNTP